MVEIEAGRSGHAGLAVLEPGDEAAVAGLFGRMSAVSLYRRFFSPVLRAEQFTRLVLRADGAERDAVAAVVDGEVVGIAQYARIPGAPRADLAIMVADSCQRQGLGTRMVAVLAARAVAAGVESFEVDVQGDNHGALRLLQRVAPGMRLAFSGGVGEGEFPVGRHS